MPTGRPLSPWAPSEGWSSILGGIPATERQRRIDAFQAGELAGLAITIGAGGVGITLTRARCMVVVDRAWTASENDQVEDRICRIGQAADTVHIVDVVADHPIDQYVARSIARKRSLIRRDVDAGAVPDWREAHRARIARWAPCAGGLRHVRWKQGKSEARESSVPRAAESPGVRGWVRANLCRVSTGASTSATVSRLEVRGGARC